MTIMLESHLSINKHSAILITWFPIFYLKTGDLLVEETKSGKALASLVAPSPTPLSNSTQYHFFNSYLLVNSYI